MHSYFPHPNDRVVILRSHDEPDSADIETVQGLLKSRIEERGNIFLLLDIDCSEKAFAHWITAILDKISVASIERLAIVGEAVNFRDGEKLASSEAVRQFTPSQRKQALTWIQTGSEA